MIVIIGGGLSGLVTAYYLKRHGIPFKVIDSRDRLGGRIHTIYQDDQAALEMGATWFTSEHANLLQLLNDLGISYFTQRMGNTAFYQSNSFMPTQLISIPEQSPSYRIMGGSHHLIHKLAQQLNRGDFVLNEKASKIIVTEKDLKVIASTTYTASKIVLALPPKLWSRHITFQPELPMELVSIAHHTHTWMEDSIKVSISYRKPFWESDLSSGTLFTQTGPITEFYDHSNHDHTKYALCGFIKSDLSLKNPEERKTKILKQLQHIYGSSALDYLSYQEKVWSADKNTSITSDAFLAPHQNNGHPAFSKAIYDGKIIIGGSETASKFPGYMDGAICAGKRVAQLIIKNNGI